MTRFPSRIARAAALTAALALTACMVPEQRAAEPDAADADSAFRIVEGGGGRLTVEAAGRRVVIAPPDGACVDPETVRHDGPALFVMIADCDASGTSAVTMLSVGQKGLFGADPETALDDLAALMETEIGREGAGMGGDAGAIRILATRRSEDALYVLVEDLDSHVAETFGVRFWRAFTELNGRAAIASLGVPGATAEHDDEVLLQLSRFVAAMRAANGASPADLAQAPTGGAEAG